MLSELAAVLAAVPASAGRSQYAEAIVDGNCLGKQTASTRRLTNQRLGELYALDPSVPIFRILRRLWDFDPAGRPLLALLSCLARDPLLAATANCILSLPVGAELAREELKRSLRAAVASRLNDSVLDKVVRNAASSWTQSGHLEGRVFKKRRFVRATPAAMGFALYLAHRVGFRGDSLLRAGWIAVLDCAGSSGRDLAFTAKRLGLIDLRMAGEVVELQLERLDPWHGRSANGTH